MDENKENQDLNNEKDTQEDESASDETNESGSEDLKNADITQKAEHLMSLKDGTPADKNITISKKKYDDQNEKAKLYETHAPLLEKVLRNPKLVEELLETQTKGNLEERLVRLEEEKKLERRRELKEALENAISQWDNFEKDWPELQEDVERFVRRGYSYQEAIQRNYLAMHPEAVQAEAERMAQNRSRGLGEFSRGSSYAPRFEKMSPRYKLTDDEKMVAQIMGKSEEEYGRLLEKHKDWLDARGFNQI